MFGSSIPSSPLRDGRQAFISKALLDLPPSDWSLIEKQSIIYQNQLFKAQEPSLSVSTSLQTFRLTRLARNLACAFLTYAKNKGCFAAKCDAYILTYDGLIMTVNLLHSSPILLKHYVRLFKDGDFD